MQRPSFLKIRATLLKLSSMLLLVPQSSAALKNRWVRVEAYFGLTSILQLSSGACQLTACARWRKVDDTMLVLEVVFLFDQEWTLFHARLTRGCKLVLHRMWW